MLQAAEPGAELARRIERAGNFNKLQRAREQAFEADAQLGLARAEWQQRASRERLARLLGLADDPAALRLPDNTAAMMTGSGPHGPVGMGGMFSVLKVRPELGPDSWADPGWYKPPASSQAFEPRNGGCRVQSCGKANAGAELLCFGRLTRWVKPDDSDKWP